MLARLILFASTLALATSLFAQTNPAPAKPAQENATQANGTASGPPDWSEPFPPHRMIGNVYYVGSRGLASYLITTPAGHILINSNLTTSVPLIRESVEKLGFQFRDIKILLISHAHFDHDGGSAEVKKLTGAKYMVMDTDVGAVESGGKSDFQYGDDPTLSYPATTVDRVLHDGDEVKLGDTVVIAHKAAGHTRGCTTWSLKVREGGSTYDVVIVGSPNVNPGYKLVHNASYPEIADDYARGFRVLKSLPCDVFLGAHGSYYGMEEKHAKLNAGGVNPYIDPAGYRNYVAEREQAFLAELQKQTAAVKKQ
jgi:metallo-beta-lactamase class B